MIRSMTAYARAEAKSDWGTALWELRSVNNRYLDVSTRLPEDLRSLEPAVRERVGARVGRGKIECALRYQPSSETGSELTLNMQLAKQLAKATRDIDALLYEPSPVHSVELLRWPGVIEASQLDLDAVGSTVITLLNTALDDLIATRGREGEKIDALIGARCKEARRVVGEVRARMPEILSAMRERLLARLDEVKEQLEPQRLEQEMVFFSQKVDVAEELERLDAHLEEVERVLQDDKPVGRRLDFLMQEMNREANTLASKSADTETTRASVDLKVLIEQMREQIQNVE